MNKTILVTCLLYLIVSCNSEESQEKKSVDIDTQSREQRLNEETQKRALDNTIAQRAEVKMLFAQLRKLNPVTSEYKDVLSKVEKLQPGITEQYKLQWGAIDDLRRAEDDLSDSIMKRALIQARAGQVKEAAQKVVDLEDKLADKQKQGL